MEWKSNIYRRRFNDIWLSRYPINKYSLNAAYADLKVSHYACLQRSGGRANTFWTKDVLFLRLIACDLINFANAEKNTSWVCTFLTILDTNMNIWSTVQIRRVLNWKWLVSVPRNPKVLTKSQKRRKELEPKRNLFCAVRFIAITYTNCSV